MSGSPTINTQPTPVPGPSSSPTSPLGKEHLEGEALVSALKQQLEFYFSKQNLATDAYLLSHMNASKYVPVEIIAGFRKVRMLTEDRAFLVDVMKQCRNLVVDENGTHVRPNIKMERTTLILRDIPASTPADDIKQIFASPSAPAKPIAVRSDIDDTWFVTFESEDACTDTALWLPSQTFQGKPVKCRVKSENLLRGFYYPNSSKEAQPVTTPIPMPQVNPYANPAGAPFYGNGYMPYGGAYPYGAYPQQGYGQPTQSPPQVNQRLDGKHERRNKAPNGTQAPNSRKRGKGADATGSVQVVAAASGAVTVTGVVSPTNAAAAPAASVPGTGKKALKKARKAAAAAAAAASTSTAPATDTTTAPATAPKTPDVALGIEHFPALPNNPTVKKTTSISGYSSSFVEYDREAMASIIAALMSQSYPKPDTFPTDPESVIVRKTVLPTCQLLQPFPVIYPASPSPELAAQPIHSGAALMPFLDLGVGPAAAVLAGRNPHVEQPKKKAPAAASQPQKPKKANTPTASAAPAPAPAAAPAPTATATSAPANGKPKATKPSKPKYQKAGTAAAAAAAAAASAASTSTSSTPTAAAPAPAPVTPAVPVVTAASIVAANANLPLQPNPKQVAAAKAAAEAKEREAREKAEKLAAAEAAKQAAQQKKPKYQPKGTKAAHKDKANKQDKEKDATPQQPPQQEAKSNEPPKIKWAAKVGSVDPAITLAKLAKAKKEAQDAKDAAEAKTKAEADAKNPPSSSPSASTSTTSTSTPASASSSPSTSSAPSSSSSSSSSVAAAAAAAAAAAEEEANKKLSYAEMARRAKNAAAAAAAAAAANSKSNGIDTPASPTTPASPSH